MRIFVGLPVPMQIAGALARHATATNLAEARWIAPDAMHITLAFLGEAAEERLACVVQELRALEMAPVEIRLGALGVFAGAGVLFAEVERASELLELRAQTVGRMAGCGFSTDQRPYHPHITLARFLRLAGIRPSKLILPEASRLRFTVDEVNLYRSDAAPGGSRYKLLAQKKANG